MEKLGLFLINLLGCGCVLAAAEFHIPKLLESKGRSVVREILQPGEGARHAHRERLVQIGDPDGDLCDPFCALGLTRCPAGSKRICRKGSAVKAGRGITNIYPGVHGYSCACQQDYCNSTDACPACLDYSTGYFRTCVNGLCGCSQCNQPCSKLVCAPEQRRLDCKDGNCRCENVVCSAGSAECSDVNGGAGKKGGCNLGRCVCMDENSCFTNSDCSGDGNCCASKSPHGVCSWRLGWRIQGCPFGNGGSVQRRGSCGVGSVTQFCHCLA